MESTSNVQRPTQTVEVPAELIAEIQKLFPIVPYVEPNLPAVVPKAKAGTALATQLVDTFVENDPRVTVARQRYEELNRIGDRLCSIGVMPATLGVIGGLVAAMSAFTEGGPAAWIAGGCACVVGAGCYIARVVVDDL